MPPAARCEAAGRDETRARQSRRSSDMLAAAKRADPATPIPLAAILPKPERYAMCRSGQTTHADD